MLATVTGRPAFPHRGQPAWNWRRAGAGGPGRPARRHPLVGDVRLQVSRWRAQYHQQVVEVPALDRRPAAWIAATALVPAREGRRLRAPAGRPTGLHMWRFRMHDRDPLAGPDRLPGPHADRDVLGHVDVLAFEGAVQEPVHDDPN